MAKPKVTYVPTFTVNAANEMHRIATLNNLSAEDFNKLVKACKLYAISESGGDYDPRQVLCGDVTKIAESLGYEV